MKTLFVIVLRLPDPEDGGTMTLRNTSNVTSHKTVSSRYTALRASIIQ